MTSHIHRTETTGRCCEHLGNCRKVSCTPTEPSLVTFLSDLCREEPLSSILVLFAFDRRPRSGHMLVCRRLFPSLHEDKVFDLVLVWLNSAAVIAALAFSSRSDCSNDRQQHGADAGSDI